MCTGMEIVALVGAAAAAAGTANTIANSSGGGGGAPAPPPLPKMPGQEPADAARKMLPGTKADAAARGLQGSAPEFLASMVDQNTGVPGGGLDILSEIRRGLGQGGAP